MVLCLWSRPPAGSTLVAQVTFTPGKPWLLRQITMTPGRFSCGSGSGYTQIANLTKCSQHRTHRGKKHSSSVDTSSDSFLT